ncbi:ABC transporter ATP-binding protein [Natronosporangium hydrolyticum]|uniref:ABC transporter ATP-binding protein n=1 Tax=Natronosporangium hydrolyticum TaxID=2811111 RepID=A0A895YAA0_9ACTN|nr:ABC transporter ATP-binding protein [Natronosporangium hydrolyticum]QSB13182.1 ABC transporter ATP-binding protein [Natronosporangium hydrolyticum]
MSTPVLELAHGVVGYHGRPVLPGVSLRVNAGEVVAILGANGSGKSTLIKAALGLLPLTAGSARLFDTPLGRFRQRYRLGYVPQRAGAGSGVPATVTELVSAGRLPRRRLPWPRWSADRAAVTHAIAVVGLTEKRREPVGTLSGGQQQRALIARALACEPELLVLDEPTAGVDAASQVAFAGALRHFVDAGGTVVLVAHELGPLAPLITRTVVLHEGRVVQDTAGAAVATDSTTASDPGTGHHDEPPAPSPVGWQPSLIQELPR